MPFPAHTLLSLELLNRRWGNSHPQVQSERGCCGVQNREEGGTRSSTRVNQCLWCRFFSIWTSLLTAVQWSPHAGGRYELITPEDMSRKLEEYQILTPLQFFECLRRNSLLTKSTRVTEYSFSLTVFMRVDA